MLSGLPPVVRAAEAALAEMGEAVGHLV